MKALRFRGWRYLEEPARIAIPFAPHLSFPSELPRHRRDHEKFLRLIEAAALLYQHQRERRDGAVLAAVDDYRIAYELARPVLARANEEVTAHGRQALFFLRDREILEFTRRDLARGLGWPGVRVWRVLQELLRADFVVRLGAGPDRRIRYRVLEFYREGDLLTRLLPPEEVGRRVISR